MKENDGNHESQRMEVVWQMQVGEMDLDMVGDSCEEQTELFGTV